MLIDAFNHTIDTWINIISDSSFQSLCKTPDEKKWSVGQICMHLLNDTNWFIEQMNICLLNSDNAKGNMTSTAKILFVNNSFPDAKLTNPHNVNMPQPESKEQMLNSFIKLKKEMNDVVKKLNDHLNGKTKHPGFGYFNATEWLQFTEMHLRHHLKQQQRIKESTQ